MARVTDPRQRGENNLGNNNYIVPAIFLKYTADKIRNDYIEKGVITALDIATIYCSGGVALASKVTWVRRAWAMAEVAGAVGNIAVNTQTIDPHSNLGKAVNAYNLGLGVIGVKNVAQGGYKFVSNLPQATRTLLQENKGVRELLKDSYLKFKSNFSRSKALGEYDDLDNTAKGNLNKQELILDDLAKEANTTRAHFAQQQIDKYVKEATHTNPNGYKKVMLGKYDKRGPTSYITRAGQDYTYFDFGDKWDDLFKIVNSNDEMWKINKQFLHNQKELGSDFYFSHNPREATGFLKEEVKFLNAKDYKEIEPNLWKAIW